MQGLDIVHESVRNDTNKHLRMLYGAGLYDPNQIEDIILMTRRRVEFPNIGTDSVNLRNLMYVLENIYWMNVCLYVNNDFRSCFDDAITIEKALLRVNDEEYQDFRDDMTLDDEDGSMPDKKIGIDLMGYSEDFANAITSRIDRAKNDFYNAGMTEVYSDLAGSFEADTKAGVSYIIHNLMYVINAFNRNGVFRKYATLVIDSVRKQLS